MKDVYVIKVKTKPSLSSLYPSERRYSASTVGGLSLIHLGLSILAFLLGTLARSIQGPILSLACLVPFVSGLFAWRRWYMDKNISYFFYGSLFSLVISILCCIASVFDVVAIVEISGNRTTYFNIPKWEFGDFVEYNQEKFQNNEAAAAATAADNIGQVFKNDFENCNDTNNSNENNKIGINCTEIIDTRPVEFYFDDIRNGFFSFWQRDDYSQGFINNKKHLILDINVLVTCILEICWCLLSVKISLRGMRNRIADITHSYDYCNKNNGFLEKRIKPRAPNPTFGIDNRRHVYFNDDNNLYSFSDHRRNSFIIDNSIPRLPLPESKIEFRERVERFLANQAAHRIVEGSCS